jgi:tol-pal system protein YbgF
MVPHSRSRGPLRPAIFIAALLAGVAAPAYAAPSFFGPQPQVTAPADGRIYVAQNQNTAELLVRIQDLEELVRQLTGRIEGLEFQVVQMQKQAQDNELRFQELEGGTPVGKPQAAVPTDGVTPSDALPQEQTPAVTADTPAQQLPATPDTATPGTLTPLAHDPSIPDLPETDQPLDFGIGESHDPLLRGGTDQLGTLGEGDALANVPFDPNRDGGVISNGDAKAQYEAGYDAMTRGDYAFAEDQFSQFIELFPSDPSAPDAINYLGEALIQRGAYTDAAQVLAEGYTKHKDSKRAPDIMLKLGVALAGAEQVDVACRTFATLKQRYPGLSTAFQQRLEAETLKAQCPLTN